MFRSQRSPHIFLSPLLLLYVVFNGQSQWYRRLFSLACCGFKDGNCVELSVLIRCVGLHIWIRPLYTRFVQKKTELLLWKLYCSFYNILSTVPLKVVPSTCNTPFPTFLPFLECLLERTCCDGAQFSCRIFLNLLYGLETTSFQSGFKLGKQEKVCWG